LGKIAEYTRWLKFVMDGGVEGGALEQP